MPKRGHSGTGLSKQGAQPTISLHIRQPALKQIEELRAVATEQPLPKFLNSDRPAAGREALLGQNGVKSSVEELKSGIQTFLVQKPVNVLCQPEQDPMRRVLGINRVRCGRKARRLGRTVLVPIR